MRILLTENSPIGMLALSSYELTIIDFFPLGRYEDPVLDINDYIDMCNKELYDKATHIYNKSPLNYNNYSFAIQLSI